MVHPSVPARSRVGRAGAALSLLSATLHAACDGTHCTTVWVIVLPALMSLGCLWCAWDLWTSSPGAWPMTAAMSSAMLVLHFAIPMPGAAMHQAYLAALADLVLSGGMLLRTFVFRRPSRADGPCHRSPSKGQPTNSPPDQPSLQKSYTQKARRGAPPRSTAAVTMRSFDSNDWWKDRSQPSSTISGSRSGRWVPPKSGR